MKKLTIFLIILSTISSIVFVSSILFFIIPVSSTQINDINSSMIQGELNKDIVISNSSPIYYKDYVNASSEIRLFDKSISKFNNLLIVMPTEVPINYLPNSKDNAVKIEIQVEDLIKGINASLIGETLVPNGYTGSFIFNSSLKNLLQFKDGFTPDIKWSYSINYKEILNNYSELDSSTKNEMVTSIKDKVYSDYKEADISTLQKTFFDREAYLEPNISACGTISSPGTYLLNTSISNYGATCIMINSSNVIFDCQNNVIGGKDLSTIVGIWINGTSSVYLTNVTIQNCSIIHFIYGIHMTFVNSSLIRDTNVSHQHINAGRGFSLNNVIFSRFENIISFNQTGTTNIGVSLLTSSNYNNFTNGILTTGSKGFSIGGVCIDNTITGFNITKIDNYGVYISGASSNKFYNNFFNNTNNTFVNVVNYWNSTLTAGTNIVGGANIGGNFWANSTGGFSETCTDADANGICDNLYNITSTNIDYLPLSSIITAGDLIYPIFSSFTTVPINNSYYSNGIYSFNSTILNSNGTVGIGINGVNYSASNLSYVFNRTFYLNNYGTYNYYWWAYGNGTNHNFNTSNLRSYIILKPYININITYPLNDTTYYECILAMNYTLDTSNASVCWYNDNVGSNIITCGNNITGLVSPQGFTTWSVCANDSFGNSNCSYTTFFSDYVDITPPNATLLTPANGTLNITAVQNFTANFTDNKALKNATLYIYNSTGLYNSTTINLGGATQITAGISVFLIDNSYNWSYLVFDSAGNSYQTENWTITIDTTSPLISYGIGTAVNGANLSQNWTYVNVSFTELLFANITFSLFNDTDVVNSTIFTTATYSINWTNLINGNYSYQVNVTDLVGFTNFTEIRYIRLDTTLPNATLLTPTNGSLNTTAVQNFTVNISENNMLKNATLYIYNQTGVYNVSTTNVTGKGGVIGFLTTLIDGIYTWFVKVFDIAGNGFRTGNWTITIDTTPPYFTDFKNKTMYDDETLSYHIGASDAMTLVSCFTVNATYNFSITCAGVLTSVASMQLGYHYINITVNDTLNNLLSGVMWVNVLNASLIPTEPWTFYNNSEDPNNRLFAISESGDVILEKNGSIQRRRVGTKWWIGETGNSFMFFNETA